MKIDISKYSNPYDAVTDKIFEIAGYMTNYIVRVRTTNLGDATVLLYEDSDYDMVYDTDWYEGGDVELLGFIPVEDVVVPNNVDKENANE